MPRAKATGGRDSRPDSSRLKRITDERNEVGWRTNVGTSVAEIKEGQQKKEKREEENWKKNEGGNKGKKKYWKKRGERERERKTRRYVKKVVPLLFFSFSRTHRRSLNPIPLILKQTNTYRMYHGGWTKGTYGLESKEGRRVGRGVEKKA